MNPVESLKGIITVLNTLFTIENKLDIPALQKNVHLALEAGVAGFLVPVMASEAGQFLRCLKDWSVEFMPLCQQECTASTAVFMSSSI